VASLPADDDPRARRRLAPTQSEPSVNLKFLCLAVTHTSGRVTLTPLELPDFAVHAATLEQARFELTLALDDKLSRTHPKHLWRFCRPGEGELRRLTLPLLPVQTGGKEEKVSLELDALEGPAHGGNTEVRLLAEELRYWFAAKGKALATEASALLSEHLRELPLSKALALRAEGKVELVEVAIDAAPLKLATLSKRELTLDERPPPRGLDDFPEPRVDPDDADAEEKDEEHDGWDDELPKKKAQEKKKGAPTPTLDRVGVKWHQLVRDDAFPPTFGRDALVDQVLAHLAQKDPEPLVLIGPSGVGKTAVLQEVARRLVAKAKDEPWKARLFHLDGSRLIAGGGFFGEWQQQTLDAFAEATEAKAVLHLGRIIDLLDAGRSAHGDDNVAQLITPMLAGREVAVVGEATPEEWARLRDRNQSFARVFAPLVLEEPPAAETTRIIERLSATEAKERRLTVEPAALVEVRSLVRRFRPYGSALGTSIAFLRRLLDGLEDEATLTRNEVTRRFSIESGVPEELLRDDLPLRLDDVREFLSARVKGQADAVARVAQVVSVVKANLADPGRPVATLLFAGPTGVGKTELTKALAERVFGAKERMVRLDMGEFSGPDALLRLVGDAGSEGFLSSAVRRQPFSVVLLDEIEKAHPAVFDALLSVLGEGRLTDGRGRTADFRSAIIVMTSNLGAQTQRPRVGFGDEANAADVRAHYLAEIRRFFRPELFNRLDDVVVFAPLTREQLGHIVVRELAKVSARGGFGRLGVTLDVSPGAQEQLATWGHEPKYGARPLKRALERHLVVPAAAHLAAHPPPTSARLEVALEGQALAFSLHPAAKGVDSATRAELLAVCERAAELRAEVRAWHQAPLMRQLHDDFRLFERLSKQPSFWADRELADAQARKAGLTRDLDESFTKVRAQVEAVEELAFEAWATREQRSVQELDASLDAAQTAFEPLSERLYASRLPPAEVGTLTLVPGKGALDWALWLRQGYLTWASSRGLRFEQLALVEKGVQRGAPPPPKKSTSSDEVERTLQQQGLGAAAKLYRDKHGGSQDEAMRQVQKLKQRLEAPPPVELYEWKETSASFQAPAIALKVFGPSIPLLLAAEHGLHRFYAAGEAFEVKVRFTPGNVADLGQGEALEVTLPAKEVRRIWPTRKGQEFGLLKDQRTNTEHRVAEHFELAPVLAAWVRHVVFGEESSWS
jgi:ATP-dependent Clp protease ATP-binding subunit ClpA